MSSPQPLREIPAAQQIFQMLAAKSCSQAVSVAADLGIADVLTDAPRSVEELAAATSTHADSLYRLLRALPRLPAPQRAGFHSEYGALVRFAPRLAQFGRTTPFGRDRGDRRQAGSGS